MALTNPPDAWTTVFGSVWGTDVDESTSVNLTGARSLHFKSGNSSDVHMKTSQSIPVTPDDWYSIDVVVQASTTGGRVGYQLRWYDSSGSSVSTDTNFGGLGVANTWSRKSGLHQVPSTAAYVDVHLLKDNGSFDAYFDRVSFEKARPGWDVYRSTSQSISGSTSTDVEFDTEERMLGASMSSGVITVDAPGDYFLDSMVFLSSLPAGKYIQAKLKINGADIRLGSRNTNGTSSSLAMESHVTGIFTLEAGDDVEIAVFHDNGSSLNVTSGKIANHFSAFRL